MAKFHKNRGREKTEEYAKGLIFKKTRVFISLKETPINKCFSMVKQISECAYAQAVKGFSERGELIRGWAYRSAENTPANI